MHIIDIHVPATCAIATDVDLLMTNASPSYFLTFSVLYVWKRNEYRINRYLVYTKY